MMRRLSEDEEKAVHLLVSGLDEIEQQLLLADLLVCSVESVTKDGARLQFIIPGYQRPPYHGQHSYGVGGALKDKDGTDVDVTLYADENHRILELELIKWGDGPLIKPDWRSFQVQF